MKLKHILTAGVAVVALSPGFLKADNGEGALRVRVVKPDGAPLSGVILRASVAIASATQINSAIVNKTDQNGIATFYKLTPGLFTIQVEADGYQAGALRTDVESDRMSHITVHVRPLPVVEIAIEDVISKVDPSTYTSGTIIRKETLETYPLGWTGSIASKLQLDPSVDKTPTGNIVLVNTPNASDIPILREFNTYLMDGVDIGNALGGGVAMDINENLLSQMEIKTGGITSEYAASSGAFIHALTITGSNTHAGGLETGTTLRGLSAKPGVGKGDDQGVSGYRYMGYMSGPILKDRLWYVVSGGRTSTGITTDKRRIDTNDEANYLVKLTWNINGTDRVVAEHYKSASEWDDGANSKLKYDFTSRHRMGGTSTLLWYAHQSADWMLDLRLARSETFRTITPNVIGDYISVFDLDNSLVNESGGLPGTTDTNLGNKQIRIDVAAPYTIGTGSGLIKIGFEHKNYELYHMVTSYGNTYQTADTPSVYWQAPGKLMGYDPFPMLDRINQQSPLQPVRDALDINHDGVVTVDELMQYQFGEYLDAGRPDLGYGFLRQSYYQQSPTKNQSLINGIYLNNTINLTNWTIQAGIRYDYGQYKNNRGATVYDYKTAVTPRVGVIWDPGGDARSKLYINYGRYFDRPQMDYPQAFNTQDTRVVQLAETRLAGHWVELARTREGGALKNLNGLKNPYTDEIRAGYERNVSIGKSSEVFGIVYTHRRDRNITELINAYLYSDPDLLEWECRVGFGIPLGKSYASLSPGERHAIDRFRALALPYEYFNAEGMDGRAVVQWSQETGGLVNGNLPGAKRDHHTVQVSFDRPMQEGWGGGIAYVWNRSTGNNLSHIDDGAGGDTSRADPRLGYNNGRLDGSIDWMVKAHCEVTWKGWAVGVAGKVASGRRYSPSQLFGGVSPILLMPGVDGIDAESRGSRISPREAELHARIKYLLTFSKVSAELGLTINNLFNHQGVIAVSNNDQGYVGVKVGDPIRWNDPRSLTLEARIRF